MKFARFRFVSHLTLIVAAAFLSGCAASLKVYEDGRPITYSRMEAKDDGVVLRHGNGPDSCDSFGARDVWVFEHDGAYYMHYDGAGPKGWICIRAKSQNLRTWQKEGPILELGKTGEDDSRSACYGIPVSDGKQWHLFYFGTGTATDPPDLIPSPPYFTLKARAKSPLGPWKKQKNVVPFRPKPDTYYSATASPGPVLADPDGGYMQVFSASEGVNIFRRTFGIARTKDLNTPWKIDPNPILPPDEQLENANFYYQKETGTWFLFANHVGIEGGYEHTDAIWVYWTNDFKKWDPRNKAVVLDGKNCTWSRRIIGLPSVMKFGSRLAIFYDGSDSEELGHMHRDIGLAWLELPLRPPPPPTASNE